LKSSPARLALASTVTALVAGIALLPVAVSAAAPWGVSDPGRVLGCPARSNPSGFKFWIHVKQWCAEPAVRGQAQFKLQMQIHNRDQDDSLDISQGRMRLIVQEFDLDRWTPPASSADRPIRVRYEHESVWAVPANPNGVADPDPLPGIPNNYTFATHWETTTLDPGATLNPGPYEGDLVFYIPAPRHHGAVENVVGMAYVKGHEVIALCRVPDWGPREPAESF
jgi:hypothetical protein